MAAAGMIASMSKEHTIDELIALAERLVLAPNLLPRHARTVPEILAITLAGQELGWAPMASLRNLQMVSGKVTLTADSMLGLVAKAGIGIEWTKDGSTDEAELVLTRGDVSHVQRFTEADRARAGLNTQTWKSYKPAMMRARCVSAAIRAFCPDVLSGAYLPGELPDDRLEEGVGGLDQLSERGPAHLPPYTKPLSAEAKAGVAAAKAQGFVPKHAIAEDPFVAVDLQCLTSRGALTGWIRSGIERAGSDADAKAVVWEAFCQRCADLETCSETGEILAPKEILAEARK